MFYTFEATQVQHAREQSGKQANPETVRGRHETSSGEKWPTVFIKNILYMNKNVRILD